ncbi:alpha/beta fold hydrolase [Halosegnis marinus]|uniref:Alpha/beta fold hydrolase n=1 Tax=Halosegnis marinus TaxID=3034023 RepID=A0ABD5ZST7_9EURY|nr:alpha/beta hydrolase [Halosegnis sp. DT85]
MVRAPSTNLRRGTAADHPYVGYGDGPPLLVLPGVNDPLLRAGERAWFDLVLAAYCRRQARACAAAGAPRTVYYLSRPPGVPDTVAGMGDRYRAALDAFGPCDLVGVSMGGFLALDLARRDDRVRSVTLALSAARLSRHGRESLRAWTRWADAGEWLRVYRAGVRAVVTGARRRLGALAVRGFDAVRSPPADDIRRTFRAALAFDARPWLGEVGVPALVVGGTADPFFTDAAFAGTADGLGARHERLDGWGHDAMIEGGRLVDGAVAGFLR